MVLPVGLCFCLLVSMYLCMSYCWSLFILWRKVGNRFYQEPKVQSLDSRLSIWLRLDCTHSDALCCTALRCTAPLCCSCSISDIGRSGIQYTVYSIQCNPSPGYQDTRYYLTASSRDEKTAVGCTALHSMREMNLKMLKVKVLGRPYLQDPSWRAVESPLHGA